MQVAMQRVHQNTIHVSCLVSKIANHVVLVLPTREDFSAASCSSVIHSGMVESGSKVFL